jgi:hypothetical protein
MNPKFILLLALVLACFLPLRSQVVLHSESFETDGEGTRYTSNTYSFCPTDPDYFLRTNSNPVLPGGCSVGFGSTLTGLQGSFFWAGEDIMSNQLPFPGNHAPGQITTQNINIGGYGSLQVSLYLATASNTGTRWESADSINIQVSIDGGAYRTVGRFMGNSPAGGRLRIDADLDGAITGADPLTNCDTAAFVQRTFSISGSGTTLNVRLDFDQWGGTEESAIDLIQVQGILQPCTPPTITCPATQALPLNGNCEAIFPDYSGLALVTGTCSPTVAQSPSVGAVQSGAGPVTVTLTATNTASQATACTFTVNVVDVTAPTAICQNITVYLDTLGLVSVPASQVDNGSIDNCAMASLALDFSNFTCGDIGVQNVVLTGTDVAGNTGTCAATITVLDSIAPVAICQSFTLFLDSLGNGTLNAGDVNNGSTDNCGILTETVTPNTFDRFDQGPNVVVLTVGDGSGNTATCSVMVTVLDTLVGIDEGNAGGIRFSVSPNPAQDVMHVQVECASCGVGEPLFLQLWNMTGQRMDRRLLVGGFLSYSFEWDLQGLPAGLYLLSLHQLGGVRTLRVVKE